ncbi:MAG: nucleotidyltransferase domain-containing protein [Syntrophaceae bacterium]|nr:nucleotidyltransferase domain-containing protein [Syntrophaceae bacterium]
MGSKRDLMQNLCKEFGIDILYVFGSRSKEVAAFLLNEESAISPGPSDADLGIKLIPGRGLGVREKVLLAIRLEDLLGVNRVDLVTFPEADPFLAADIVRGERLFARDEDQADEYELYILRRAGDLIPLEKERERLIFKEEG